MKHMDGSPRPESCVPRPDAGGPARFPVLHARYVDLARRIGLVRVLALYVANGNGVVNAYAFSGNARLGYVVLHAEVAELFDRDPATVELVMAHELAHHRLGHVSLWRTVLTVVPSLMVLPAKAMSRAQEYSADRVGAHHCGGAVNGCMSLLAAGRPSYRQVNWQAYREQCEERHVHGRPA